MAGTAVFLVPSVAYTAFLLVLNRRFLALDRAGGTSRAGVGGMASKSARMAASAALASMPSHIARFSSRA